MYRVLADENVRRRVLAEPNARAAAIEETLRIDPPVTMITRFTEKDITVAGVSIPANCPVLLGIGAANRDPRQFEDPTQFSLDRGTINHITFGRGPHFCIGAHLARAEMRATLDSMLGRLSGLRTRRAKRGSFPRRHAARAGFALGRVRRYRSRRLPAG
jgi:cytochrome P450